MRDTLLGQVVLIGLCKGCCVFTRGLRVSVPPGPLEEKDLLSQLWLEDILADL